MTYLWAMVTPEILVLARHRHPRLRYVLREAGRRLSCIFRLVTDREEYQSASAVGHINYGAVATELEEVKVYAHSFLSGHDPVIGDLRVELQSSSVKKEQQGQTPASGKRFFYNEDRSDFDPFSIIFFCLSRYEEYQPFTADDFGRFPATASHARRNGYLAYPLVDHLLARLGLQLGLLAPGEHRPATLTPTYDVDVPFAYRLRGPRGFASGLRDFLAGRFRRAAARALTLLDRRRPDPFDTFAFLRQLHAATGVRPRVFFLLSEKRSTYDPNPGPSSAGYRRLIQATSSWAEVGIHPSFHSSRQPELIGREKKILQNIIEGPVYHSRQHFLKFNLPDTYRELLKAGLNHDHSMGYADEIGWRASTNFPFQWYDLEREKMTHLLVHPFGAMDVTLLRYLKLRYFEVSPKIKELENNLSPLGGPFVLLWHNSSFAPAYGWQGWREVWEKLNS